MLILMRGWPGSGKSTLVKEKYPDAKVFSADNYFLDHNGEYCFNPEKLPDAHAQCNLNVHNALQDYKDDTIIVVDNCNILNEHMRPYVAMAVEYGHSVFQDSPENVCRTLYRWNEGNYVMAMGDAVFCWQRCLHGVPLSTIVRGIETFDISEVERKDVENWELCRPKFR